MEFRTTSLILTIISVAEEPMIPPLRFAIFLFLTFFLLPAQLLSNAGDLDPTFGTGGKVTADFLISEAQAFSTAVQIDGKIIVAGSVFTGKSFDFALIRYNTDGTRDSSFGSGGMVTTDFTGHDDQANVVVIQSDGKIIAAGSADDPPFRLDFAI